MKLHAMGGEKQKPVIVDTVSCAVWVAATILALYSINTLSKLIRLLCAEFIETASLNYC